MLLVVGLGNPDRAYADNRHNVGFMVIDELASMVKAEAFRKKFSAQYARCELGKSEAVLLKPRTYMNLSGDSVQPAAAFFKVLPEEILVIHDEIDLPFGDVRLKRGGGHAGNNGVRSIIARLKTPDFCRLRFGVGRPGADFRGEVADWVLRGFSPDERRELPNFLRTAAESVLDIAARGLQAAMNTRNTRPKKAQPPEQPDR